MRIIRKFLTALLALCLIFSMVTTALTVGAETVDSGTCGDNLTWELDSEGTFTISGKGEMTDSPWDYYDDKIISVVIEDGVSNIVDAAFNYCFSLTSVTIPDSVTFIGDEAFDSCDSLTSVTIPDSVTSIGDEAFMYCNSLTNVTIPDSVTSIGEYAFYGCDNLEGIWVDENNPNYSSDNHGVLFNKKKTDIVQVPDGLKGEYIVPNRVTRIGEFAFFSCDSLISVTIPNSVTSIDGYVFCWCESLNSIVFDGDAPEFHPSSFYDVTATAYYPAGNSTWTDEVMQDYGGEITWVAYEAGEAEVVLEAKTDATEYLVNAPVTITVVTDKSVNNINLVNENGKYIVKTDSSCEENADGTLTWTVSTAFGTKGERSISIFTVDENGESVDSGVTVSFIVDTVITGGDDEVATYMVKAPTSAVKNESFVITVETTTSTTKVGIFNESGSALGKVSQSYADKDGVRTWTIGIKIGSRGDRTLTVKAADRSDTWSEGKQIDINVK